MKIAIIGAGPRGLSLSERLIAHSKQNKQAINLLLFDPFLPGAVWRTDTIGGSAIEFCNQSSHPFHG